LIGRPQPCGFLFNFGQVPIHSTGKAAGKARKGQAGRQYITVISSFLFPLSFLPNHSLLSKSSGSPPNQLVEGAAKSRGKTYALKQASASTSFRSPSIEDS
jgi:hypothetical protein